MILPELYERVHTIAEIPCIMSKVDKSRDIVEAWFGPQGEKYTEEHPGKLKSLGVVGGMIISFIVFDI